MVDLRRSGCRWVLVGVAVAVAAATATHAAEAPAARLLETKVITPPGEPYCGWPTLARRGNGELWVVWSGGREGHVCPFGQVRGMTSTDDGRTWTFPRVLLDSAIDDRDAGVVETSRGTLLVTTFTSLAYEPVLAKEERSPTWDAAKLSRWQSARDRLTPELRQADLGTWILRSTDGGRTWSTRTDSLVNSPHGPIALADGTLFYAGKQLWGEGKRNGVAVSQDDGVTWTWLTELPTRSGDDPAQYHELHTVQCASGRIIVQIRNHNRANEHETLQTESDDGGRTWTEPHPIGVWGYPSHLLRLRDGRLLMTYGHRRKPIGNEARLSSDDGATWSEPISLSSDGASGDLGYPSTVELGDGSLLTVWYERLEGQEPAVLRQARWRLESTP